MKEIFIFRSGWNATHSSLFAIMDGEKKYVDDGRDLPWGNFIPKWIREACPYTAENEATAISGVLVTGWGKDPTSGKTKVYGRPRRMSVETRDQNRREVCLYSLSTDSCCLVKKAVERFDRQYYCMGAHVASKYDVRETKSEGVVRRLFNEASDEAYRMRLVAAFQEDLDKDKIDVYATQHGKIKVGDRCALISWLWENTLLPTQESEGDKWEKLSGGLNAAVEIAKKAVEAGRKESHGYSYDHELGVPQGGWAEDAGIYGWDLD